ncbi:hypothetical protein ACM0JF_02690 [Mycoplasma sp. 654]|uniref:hypothetical protein n=1 Tax=unclassified Mycoplasma TaxID=2683645 RepID=UPI003A8508E0
MMISIEIYMTEKIKDTNLIIKSCFISFAFLILVLMCIPGQVLITEITNGQKPIHHFYNFNTSASTNFSGAITSTIMYSWIIFIAIFMLGDLVIEKQVKAVKITFTVIKYLFMIFLFIIDCYMLAYLSSSSVKSLDRLPFVIGSLIVLELIAISSVDILTWYKIIK